MKNIPPEDRLLPFKIPGIICPHGDEKRPDPDCQKAGCKHLYLEEKYVSEDQNGDLRVRKDYMCDATGTGFDLLCEYIDKPENYQSPSTLPTSPIGKLFESRPPSKKGGD